MWNAYGKRRGQAGFDFRADLDWDGVVSSLDVAREAASSCYGHPFAGFVASYSYEGDGLRVSKTENGTTTSYVWDVASGLPVVLQATEGATTTKYVYGLGVVLQDAAGTASWYLQDGLGSTVALTNNGGAITTTYRYDVFGAVRSVTGGPAAAFTFAGEQADQSGLIYLRARYYDPGTRRFVTKDPFVNFGAWTQTQNRYVYALNNPVGVSDPYGLWPCPGCGKIKRVASAVIGKAEDVGSAIVCGTQTAAQWAWGGLQRFGTLNCLSAGLSLAAAVTVVLAPELALPTQAGLFLIDGGLFTFYEWNNLSQLRSKEGGAFSKALAGTGATVNLAAYVGAAARFGKDAYPFLDSAADFGVLGAFGISATQCIQDVVNG